MERISHVDSLLHGLTGNLGYFNIFITMKKLTEGQTMWLGCAEYTKIGFELAGSIQNNSLLIEEFREFLIEKWNIL